jgi:hypothetical protein
MQEVLHEQEFSETNALSIESMARDASYWLRERSRLERKTKGATKELRFDMLETNRIHHICPLNRARTVGPRKVRRSEAMTTAPHLVS